MAGSGGHYAGQNMALPLSAVIAALLEPDRDISVADVRGKRVLVRADLNVPLSPKGAFLDLNRCCAADSASPGGPRGNEFTGTNLVRPLYIYVV